MSVNVSIKVDGENWSGDVDKLRTDVPGGGRKDWTPHEARRYISLTVPGTGVYYAEDYDAYAIAEIIVKKDAEIDAETYEYPDEYQPVAVSEGGRKYFFQVKGLRTNSNRWDPEERPLYSKVVYDYGTYRARDEEKKGWLSVAVNIASQPKQRDPAYNYQTDEWIPVNILPMARGAIVDPAYAHPYGNPITGHYGFDSIQPGDRDFYVCEFYNPARNRTIGDTDMLNYVDIHQIEGIPEEEFIIPGDQVVITPGSLNPYHSGLFVVPDWSHPDYPEQTVDIEGNSYLVEYLPREIGYTTREEFRFWFTDPLTYKFNEVRYSIPDDVKCVCTAYPLDTGDGRRYMSITVYMVRDGTERFTYDVYTHYWREDLDGNILEDEESQEQRYSALYTDGRYTIVEISINLPIQVKRMLTTREPDYGYMNTYPSWNDARKHQISFNTLKYIARPDSLRKYTASWTRQRDGFVLTRGFYVVAPEESTTRLPELTVDWNTAIVDG